MEQQSPLVQRAVQRLRDNIARRETTLDLEAIKAVLVEMATQKERADRLFADKEQLAAEVMSMRDELAAVYKCERKLIDTLRDVLRDRLTQTNLHQMPPAMRKRLEDARRLLAALGG